MAHAAIGNLLWRLRFQNVMRSKNASLRSNPMRKVILVVTTVSALGAVVAFAQTAPRRQRASPAAGASPAATNPPSPVNATPTPTERRQ